MTREENSFRAREMREAIYRRSLFDILRSATFCGRLTSPLRRSNRQVKLPAEDEELQA